MNRLLALPVLLSPLLAACVNDPVATMPSNNAGIQVDELFTHDACTVYRFRDGRYHYYVRCKGDAAPTTLACIGKNCKDDDAIPTLPAASR